MIILYIGIILILYSIAAKRSNLYNLTLGFIFVFIIMAFQSNVEGDYMTYMQGFGSKKSRTMEDEPLWLFLQLSFQPFGWRAFVICLSTFEVWVIYKITKAYAPYRYWYLGPILFFFTFGLMLIQMKAIRQGLATEISLLPFLLNIEKKKTLMQRLRVCYGPLCVAFLIHNSAIVTFIPTTLLFLMYQNGWLKNSRLGRKNEWYWPLIAVGLFYCIYFLKQTVFSNLFVAVSEILTMNEMRLGGYLVSEQEDGIFDISWLIVLYDAVMVFFCTWILFNTKDRWRVLIIMAIISNFADMLLFGMGSLPRIGYYFAVANVVAIPCVAKRIHNRFGPLFAILFVVFCIGYAVKTSLPWMTGTSDGGFGTYKLSISNSK